MPDDLILLFVYGTLKRGQCRAHHLDAMEFLGTVTTIPQYRLFDCGTYPGLVDDSAGNSIKGELWQVTRERMEQLDEVEGVDIGLYRRGNVQLQGEWAGRPVVAYLYLQSTDGLVDLGTHW